LVVIIKLIRNSVILGVLISQTLNVSSDRFFSYC